jgi:hypothetical protein
MKRVRPIEIVVEDETEAGRSAGGMRRLRKLAWVLDSSISIGGGRRVGLDPIIGLIPGLGDWVGAGFSLYVVYEAARMGLPARVLAAMLANVGVEALIGTVPLLGDLFDFVWKANTRNLQLVERHYDSRRKGRPIGRLVIAVLVFAALLLFALGVLAFFVARWLWNLFA